MTALGIDLGGTKLSLAVFTEQGNILLKKTVTLQQREGRQVGDLIAEEIQKVFTSQKTFKPLASPFPEFTDTNQEAYGHLILKVGMIILCWSKSRD